MNPILTKKSDIEHWLFGMNIANYTLVPDETYGFRVDVTGNVNIEGKKLNSFPVHFGRVSGDFICTYNFLTSLEHGPQSVGGVFNCENNDLTSLDFCPKEVGQHFYCGYNEITSLKGVPARINGFFCCSLNQLTSLSHGPNSIGGDFYCDSNNLKNLMHCPQTVGGEFHCDRNDISSLLYCPQSVGERFHCSNNPQLGHIQNITDFKKIHSLHRTLYHIIEEQKILEQSVWQCDDPTVNPLGTPPLHKYKI